MGGTIYFSYITNEFVFEFKEDGGIVRVCKLCAWISCISRDMDGDGWRNIAMQQGDT